MAMLQKAKDESDKKDEKKKHKKPPEASEGAEPPQASDTGGPEDDTDAQQPDSDSGDEGQTDADDSAQGSDSSDNDQDQGGDDQQDQSGDSGGGSDSQQPPQQGGGAQQGATPVPNPAAPGAGDTTSGGADTPTGDTEGGETPASSSPAGPGGTSSLPQVPMSPALQEEYDRANTMLGQMLYGMQGDMAAQAIMRGLIPQGPSKIKSVAVAALNLMAQLHKKLQLPLQLVLPFTKDVVLHVMDIGQQVKQIQYSDQETTAIMGTAYEGALRIFGVTKKHVQGMAGLVPRSQLMQHQQAYAKAHAFAKPAMDANNAAWHNPHLAGQGAMPGQAGPQTGAPAGTPNPTVQSPQPQPQGAPSGGMLTQAAGGQQ
jgi:hypothetical protein